MTLQAQAPASAGDATGDDSTTQRFCSFWLAGQYFGVPVERVQEVMRDLAMTRVPLAPGFVRGLINLRGQIVASIDLRSSLGFSEGHCDDPMSIVINTDDGPMSLLVEEIGDVVEVDDSQRELPPEGFRPEVARLINHVYKFPDSVMLVIDCDRLVEIADRPSATTSADTFS